MRKYPAAMSLLLLSALLSSCSTPVDSPATTAVQNTGMSTEATHPASVQAEPPAPQPPVPDTSAETAIPAKRYVINDKTYLIKEQGGASEKKIVLLTFDDGPVGKATTDILDVLDQHRAKSIWFVNGIQLAAKKADGSFVIKPQKAALLQEIKRRGHLIGNHTWSHENVKKLPVDRQREEIVSTSDVIEAILGEKPKFFRPPFGAYTPDVEQICKENGMQLMNWSVGSLDWDAHVYKKPHAIAKQVLSTMHDGGTILFHDRTWTARELDEVLTGLEQAGYHYALPTVD